MVGAQHVPFESSVGGAGEVHDEDRARQRHATPFAARRCAQMTGQAGDGRAVHGAA
jgi:hypothetical protein